MSLLEVNKLHVDVGGKKILNSLDLYVEKRSVEFAVEARKLLSISLEGSVG